MRDLEEELQNLIDVQCRDGLWDQNPYMHGLANGLICAMGIIKGKRMDFLAPPEIFKEDLKIFDKINNSSIVLKNKEKPK